MREVEAESSTWIGIPCKSNSGKGDSNKDGRSSVKAIMGGDSGDGGDGGNKGDHLP